MAMPRWKSPLERFNTLSGFAEDSDLFSPLQVSDVWEDEDFGERSGLLGGSSSLQNVYGNINIDSNVSRSAIRRRRDRERTKGGCRFCKYGCALCCSVFSTIGFFFLTILGFYALAGWNYIEGGGWRTEEAGTVAFNAFSAAFIYLLFFMFSAHTAVHYPQGRVLSFNFDMRPLFRGFDVRELYKHPYVLAACAVVSLFTALVVSKSSGLYTDHSSDLLVSHRIGFL